MWKLKELTLVDFKSFCGTHVFSSLQDFHMSCVVGLNGSGKSNIVDALSFILGGGSKALRSERFAELCHRDRVSGQSSGRRAQVIAHFINTSTNAEMVFKRMVNSDTSTTFSVNSKVVERKAYIKALADISAYSKGCCIVAQGYIESISLSSAQDKGQLLDRLSGSAALKEEYDAKTKRAGEIQAELKIITAKKEDVEQTLRNMKKQYADLKRYMAVRARLRRAQSMLGLIQGKELTWQIARAKARCDNIHKELEICKKKLKQQHDIIQQNVTQQQTITSSIREIKLKITKAQRAIIAKQEARTKLIDSQDELKVQIEVSAQALESAKKECTEIKKDYKNVMSNLDKDLQRLATKKTELKSSLECHPYSKISDSLKQKTASFAQKSGQEFRIQELTDEIQHAANKLASAEAYVRTTEERKKAFEDKVTSTMQELDQANAEIIELEREIQKHSSLCEKKATMDREIAQIQSTIKALTDQVYGSTDTSEKNAHVCNYLKQHRQVYGRVNDLLTVTDPRHITAVTIALGRQRNMIVVETYEDALECIKILKAKRWGVEEFMPLEGRRGTDHTAILQRLRQHGDLFRPAVDCITTVEERFMPAVTSILGDTVIIEGNLDRARDIAYRESKSFPALRIVTSDGQKIAKNGNITLGNSFDRKRPANASAMESRIQDANQQLKRLMEDYVKEGLSNCDLFATQLEAARDQLSTKRNYLTRLRAKMDELKLIMNTCLRECELALAAKSTAGQEVEKLNAERTRVLSAQTSLDEDDKRLLDLYNEAAELKSQLDAVSDEENKLMRDAVNSLLSVLARIDDEGYRSGSSEWRKELTVLSQKIELQLKLSGMVRKAETNLQQLMIKRDSLEEEFKTCESNDQEDLNLEARLRNELGELENSMKSVKELGRQANNAVRELMTEKHKYERFLYEQSEKLQEYTSKSTALEESALALPTAPEDEDITSDLQIEMPDLEDDRGDRYFRRLREKQEVDISDCNEEIKSMPLINHQADNMLEEIKAKLAVISDEFDSKKSAKNLIELDIAELRETRRKLFLKCYNAVNKYLDEIYLTLTRVDAETFGSASLELEDEISPDLFAKGVIFHAIPPGKRYTDLESLSGGEKAMAALALLFACQRYNQAPFIILDEVDAPLDLENLMALREYLQTAPFQVFMITLKEEIYSVADAIIGVYKSPVDHNSHTITVSLLEFAARESAAAKVGIPIIQTAMTS